MAQTHRSAHMKPMCANCVYVMPSESATTGLRCGLRYFNSPILFRKFQRMQHFPEVKAFNGCESWQFKSEANSPG
jgi:hypothetical protein